MEKSKQGAVSLFAVMCCMASVFLTLAGGWAFMLRRDTREMWRGRPMG